MSADPGAAWLWENALSNTTFANTLMTTFGLSSDQLQAVVEWRMTFAELLIHPYYIDLYGLTTISDLGWVQWWNVC